MSDERAQRPCVFCDLIARGARDVRRCGAAVTMPDAYPVTEGHVLVIPVRHVHDFFEMSELEIRDVHKALQELRVSLREQDDRIAGFNVGVNCGEVAGQTIPHAHVHLIPSRPGDTPNPRGGVRGVIPDRMDYGSPQHA